MDKRLSRYFSAVMGFRIVKVRRDMNDTSFWVVTKACCNSVVTVVSLDLFEYMVENEFIKDRDFKRYMKIPTDRILRIGYEYIRGVEY